MIYRIIPLSKRLGPMTRYKDGKRMMSKASKAVVSVSLLPLVAGLMISDAAASEGQSPPSEPISGNVIVSATQGNTDPQPAGSDAEIVVTGTIRRSLEAAAEIKRDSVQVVDSIVAEEIGKFPDPTTAAALQRVPGVQVTVGANNEITGVVIRGLGDPDNPRRPRVLFHHRQNLFLSGSSRRSFIAGRRHQIRDGRPHRGRDCRKHRPSVEQAVQVPRPDDRRHRPRELRHQR